MSSKSQPEVTIRVATPEDSSICGQICYDAFLNINTAHGFPCDFPGPEATTRLLSMMFSSPGFYCVVAEIEGRVVGSNCLYERSTVGGVGPITVDPSTQHVGVGRKLMQAVMDRANGRNAGLRLVQAAFHNRSLALYTSLGFDVREPLSCVQGRTRERAVSGCVVRPAQSSDLDACNALSRRVHGYDRGAELAQATAAENCPGGRARGPHYRIRFRPGFLRACNGGDQPGHAGPDRLGGVFRWSGNPGAITKQRSAALVPGEWSAGRPADDADEHRTLQRARRCVVTFHSLLIGWTSFAVFPISSSFRHPGFESHGRGIDPRLGPTCFFGHAVNFLQGVSPFDQHIAEDEHHEPAVQAAYAQAFHILLDRRHRKHPGAYQSAELYRRAAARDEIRPAPSPAR